MFERRSFAEEGVTMKKCMRTLAVLAVAIPGLAFAGDPVPMNDSELDTVAAGLNLSSLQKLSTDQILAHPRYSEISAKAVAKYATLSESQKAQVALRIEQNWGKLSGPDQAKARAVTPAGLQHLLPK
jgi:hypothetical protein